jgi:hypothetical protein
VELKKFIRVFTRALHWSIFWARSIQSISSHLISLRSTLILSTRLRLCLPRVSFLLAFPPISYMHSSSPTSCYIPCPSHNTWLDHSNYTWRRVQVIATWGSDYRRGLVWRLDLLTTRVYTLLWQHRWSPHFTNHYRTRKVFSVCSFFNIRSLLTASNSGDSSTSGLTSLPAGSQLHQLNLLSQTPLQLTQCFNSLSGWRPSHTNLLVFSSLTDFQVTPAQSQSQNYFTTGGLPPISSSWRQAPWGSGHSNFIFQLNTCGYSPYVTSSLTRGRVCCLQLLLVLASAFILGSQSRRTHDHILLSQIRDSPNLEGQVPLFIFSRNRMTRLYPQALGSFFVASYGSQGYGGGIRPSLHTGRSYVSTIDGK